MYQVVRVNYDVLHLVSDIGGLLQGLQWIGMVLVGWISLRNKEMFIASELYTLTNSDYKK